MTRLLLTDDGKLLYSRHWPEIPEVQASIYKDAAMMNDFENRMKFLLRFPVPVINPEIAILKDGIPVHGGIFFDVDMDFKIDHTDTGYTCELLTH